MTFVNQIKSTRKADLYLISGANDKGLCWQYIIVDKLKLALFQRAVSDLPKKINLDLYGQVTLSGWGEEPPAKIIDLAETGFVFEDDESDNKVYHYSGTSTDGGKLFAFILVHPVLQKEFEAVSNSQTAHFNPYDYGEVCKWGWGNASEEDWSEVEKEFGELQRLELVE